MYKCFGRSGPSRVVPPTRRRAPALCAMLCAAVLLTAGSAEAQDPPEDPPSYKRGAPGAGDPYFPSDGNGGYDASHYALDVEYEPATDVLHGEATMTAEATQDLSSFNLNLDGLTVDSVSVDGKEAAFIHKGSELTITPAEGIEEDEPFHSIIRYHGVPKTIMDPFGLSGFFHTDDGAMIIGQPHVASLWFPVNDHPSDPAAYEFDVTVPEGLQAVANGHLLDKTTEEGKTTWSWEAEEPMASYLATVNIGKFELEHYREDGLRFIDAFDPDLFTPLEAHTGRQFMSAQGGDKAYKRLSRTVSVPAGGAKLSFWAITELERSADFAFVEARTAGEEDWTTLPDIRRHTSSDTGRSCPDWHALHPFLAHYQSPKAGGGCTSSGTSGAWHAATGQGEEWEQWAVDLSGYANKDVEVSISYVSNEEVSYNGLFIDDIVVSTGEGSTSFEEDDDTLDGWMVEDAPTGSPNSEESWTATSEPAVTLGERAQASLDRQPEMIDFLEGYFGEYPFRDAGGIVDDLPELQFALENQTRPIYAKGFFYGQPLADLVVIHELAHQWYGNSLTVADWRQIWLNEGFATYMEWLWSEEEGLDTAQQFFDERAAIPADDPFWGVTIGDPGADKLFDGAVYERGAMTVHALRQAVGDDDFFTILRDWAQENEGDNVTLEEFMAFAEDVSGEELTALFDMWLFTPEKPSVLGEGTAPSSPSAPTNIQRHDLDR